MNHIRETLNALKKKNENDDSIQTLIDTNFSASEEEKGKAAEILKGLFFSEDEKAKELIKKLDAWFSNMKTDVAENEDEDEEVNKTFIQYMTKANAKSTADKVDIYRTLSTKLVSICGDNASTKMQARKLLLDQIRTNFKNLGTGI